ncbi:MAG: hypothetical protein WD342_05035 [Verrucomicrobiales bacterium]
MAYHIEDCTGEAAEMKEIAGFLARFVAGGEGASGDIEGRNPTTWESRLGWWWKSNPYCRPDSPRGLMLRSENGNMAGFFGFIPHDYVRDGKVVPSLISTTTFVGRDSRDAALGLFLRAHRLKEEYQLVDGGPNEEMQALLKRCGYRHVEKAKLFLYPVSRRPRRVASVLMQGLRMGAPCPNGRLRSGKVITRLEDAETVPPIRDSRLRKHVDRESLEWYLDSGSQRKVFAGWCDEAGVLKCYVMGIPRRCFGVTGLVVFEAVSFDRADEGLIGELVAHMAKFPREAGLPEEIDLVAWPAQDGIRKRRSPFSMPYDPFLFYRLPTRWEDGERLCFPFEGDKALL